MGIIRTKCHDLQADCLAAITLINAPENGWHEFPMWLTETVSFPGDNDFFMACQPAANGLVCS